MKVIFLDIDGVLNTTQSRYRNGLDEITPELVYNLKALLMVSGAKIVVSSTWRLPGMPGFDALVERFRTEFAISSDLFIDQTPDLGLRGEEIEAWLGSHPEVAEYVILDDVVEDLLESQFEHTVECHSSRGFNLAALAEATAILKGAVQ